MLKLMKYELRKNTSILFALAILFVGLEGYYIVSYLRNNLEHVVIGTSLLTIAAIVCFFMVFVICISNYSREINSKTSCLIFMTPNSSVKIILSKMLYTLILGAVEIALIGTFAVIDMKMLFIKVDESFHFMEIIDNICYSLNIDMNEMWIGIFIYIIETIVSFFSVVAIAYFAITLSTTLLQNNRAKSFISVVFFLLLSFIISKIDTSLIDTIQLGSSIALRLLPSVIYNLIIVILGVMGSAKLLDRGISL